MADNEVQIDSLSIAIEESANTASKNLNSLAAGLKKLQKAVNGVDLTGAISQFDALSTATYGLNEFADAIKKLDGVKVSSALAKQLTAVGTAANGLQGQDYTKLTELSAALKPLGELGRSQLTSFINQLGKLPQLSKDLEAVDMDRFASTIERLTAAMKPLATEMDKIARGFAAFPQRIQKFIANNEKAASSVKTSKSKWNGFFDTLVNGSAKSSSGLTKLAKQMISVGTLRATAIKIKNAIESANEYIESLNLFNVSMGRFTEEGQKYAELVGDRYGIDPAEFMKMQAVVMDMSKSFGVSSDTAYTMSKALTQLTYDISSLYNLKIDEAASKVQSALAGEIEPIRRLGKDLSVANLKLLATELGINSNVDAMNQAEKAMLRTVSLLRQSTSAMGDMARTLEQPANQFRVLRAQLELLSRALGDLFLPIVQKILPYFTAFIKVTRQVVMAFAELAGFKLPEFDYGDSVDNITEVGDAADDAAKSVKKLYLLSFDELNILGNKNSSGTGTGLSAEELAKLEAELNRLAKIEDDLFSKSLGEATDKIAENMEQWLTKGKGIKEWAKDVADTFEEIKDFAAKVADKLGLWKIPEVLSSLLSSLGLDISFGKINTDYTEAVAGMSRGDNNLKSVIGLGIAGALGLAAIGAITGSSSLGGLVSKGLGLALGIGGLKMLFDDIKDDGTDTSEGNGLFTSLKRALEFALFGTSLSLLRGKGLRFSFGLGLGVAGLTLFSQGLQGLWDGESSNDLSSAVKTSIGAALGGVGLTQIAGVKDLRYSLAIGLAMSSLSMIFSGAKMISEGETLKGLAADIIGISLGGLTGAVVGSLLGVGAVAGAGWGLVLSIPLAVIIGAYFTLKDGKEKDWNKLVGKSDGAELLEKAGLNISEQKLESIIGEYEKNGGYISSGLAAGIESKAPLIKQAIDNVSDKSDETFRKAWGIHSPSTVAEEYGLNIDKGLADGVINNLGVITDAFGTVYTSIELRFDSFAESMLVKAQALVERMARIFSKMSFAGTPSLGISSYSGRVPAYASGGFPEDGMFFANSGELVGRFANGRTAVANNEEITEGIRRAVYEAVVAAQGRSGRGGTVELILDKQVVGRTFGDAIDTEKRRSGANSKITFSNGGTR